jgi:predicted nucleic acid-binding protein
MLVVADTSPINYLVLLEQTAVLPALYTRVLLPPAVVRELRDAEAPEAVRAWTANLPTWCEVRRPALQEGTEVLAHLGAGEREAIALAQELRADFLLIDEEDGRRVALSRALTVTGTRGVLERGRARPN